MRSKAFAAFDAVRAALPIFAVTVKGNSNLFQHLLLIPLLLMALCTFAASAGAREGVIWPVETNLLLSEDWTFETPALSASIGKTIFTNGRENLQITVLPDEPYRMIAVHIHLVRDMADFESVLDSKGKPKPNQFDYVTNYETPVASHSLEVPLPDDLCWSPDPEKCPPNFYAIVHADLQVLVKNKWVGVEGAAWGDNGGMFMRIDNHDDRMFGQHVTYPIAKVEPGHFFDAIVGGLGYVTITQYGVTDIVTNNSVTGDEGQFWFIPGERIAFYTGSLFIGDALADRRISPMDLFGADMDDNQVVNVARLLQSLDTDQVSDHGAINITEQSIACLESALPGFGPEDPEVTADFFDDDEAVGGLIDAMVAACDGLLTAVSYEEALANLNSGMQAGNLMSRNVSKTPDLKSDKAKIDIVPVYVPAMTSDETPTSVVYYDADGNVLEERFEAKPLAVVYLDEIEGTGAFDVWLAISRDDGDTWMRRNLSKTAGKSSKQVMAPGLSELNLLDYPGDSVKPMMQVKDNMIFVAWTDKYCHGGRPGYAIKRCDDPETPVVETPETGCAVYCTGNPDENEQECLEDYPGDDAYWKDDLFGVAGPQRTVIYEDYPEKGEVPYSCVWTTRAVVESDGTITWFKPERVTSGRRDAAQLFSGAGDDVAFAIVWQEDPKGLMAGEGDGPGDGWSGANTHSKSDIWYSYIKESDFRLIDESYPEGGLGDADFVDTDFDQKGRVKALVPMSLPVRITDNEMCSAENIAAEGGGGDGDGDGDHEYDPEGLGTHRYCGTLDGIGTEDFPGVNPLCAYTVEKENPQGVVHNVCVTEDGRLLDGNTGASRANIFLQPFCTKKDPNDSTICLTKSAWAIIGYEESKGVGSPPEDEEGCGDETVVTSEDDEYRYKPDMGKNVIFHSFKFDEPEVVSGGGIINLPEVEVDVNGDPILDENGNTIPVYLTEDPALYSDPELYPNGPPLLKDWKGDPILAYENARRIRFLTQPYSKAGSTKTVLVALYRQGAEGSGKPADIFMRRMVDTDGKNNWYEYSNFVPGAQNVSSVEPTVMWKNPFDEEKPYKMIRWTWTPDNLNDTSSKNPYTDAIAHRGALNGDDVLIGYSLTPNWGRKANDKYDFFVRRSFNGGKDWTTDSKDPEPIEHNVVFRVPVEDWDNQTVTWDEEIVTLTFGPGATEPPRNVSNLRNNRISVMEPRLVKTPGTIKNPDGSATGYPEDIWNSSIYQIAFGLELNQNQEPDDMVYPKQPLDIYYGRTEDKGQRYETVFVTPQDGSGKSEEGWNPLAKDKPEQGAAQLKQTPDGSRMYGVWLEEGDKGSDILFRRVDYRTASEQ